MATRAEVERLLQTRDDPDAGRAFGWELLGLWVLTGLVLLGAVGFVLLVILGAAWVVSVYGWLKALAGVAALAGSWVIFHALVRMETPPSQRARRAYR